MPSPTPDPALVDRFRADFERLIGRALEPDERIGVAVSGGPDSMALLLLAHAAYGARALAATVDHGLRAQAVEEAAMVHRQCEAMGVEHATLWPDQPLQGHAGVQARARAVRYRLLGQWADELGIAWIATAHHADDQAETLLMRIARGSGLAGLAGIRAVNRNLGPGPILRPLLTWRRATLRGIVEACGARFALDPSNADTVYDRTRARALLHATDWLDPERVARTAANLAEDDALIARLAEEAWNDRAEASNRAVAWRAEGLARPI
ncbi:MAG: tRNA lysidine(34) synthetase TilS, partial [Sphingomonadaceae bacterium]|nr:tRNA lysidine(34) synthetase TilS [Sphingomonadaceae bacterium]